MRPHTQRARPEQPLVPGSQSREPPAPSPASLADTPSDVPAALSGHWHRDCGLCSLLCGQRAHHVQDAGPCSAQRPIHTPRTSQASSSATLRKMVWSRTEGPGPALLAESTEKAKRAPLPGIALRSPRPRFHLPHTCGLLSETEPPQGPLPAPASELSETLSAELSLSQPPGLRSGEVPGLLPQDRPDRKSVV